MDSQSKTIWTSKTFWGAVIGLVAYLLKSYQGIVLTEKDISDLADIMANLGILVGSGLVVYGRISARKRIDVKGSVNIFALIEKGLKIWKSIKS